MTPTLTVLAGTVLSLGWQGDETLTYTVQSSDDNQHWATLPFVLAGSDSSMDIALNLHGESTFFRLRYGSNGDSNENGLPDLWEWNEFGFLDVDPDADPDEDGESNYMEWMGGTPPLDFFNGDSPVIRSANGREWILREKRLSSQSLDLTLRHSSGAPWQNAPVLLQLDSNRPAILQSTDSPGEAASEIVAYTDSRGRISAESHDIRIVGSALSPEKETLLIRAGSSELKLSVRTLPSGYAGPPRNLSISADGDTPSAVSWRGDPGECMEFILEEQLPNGDWTTVAAIPAEALPENPNGNFHYEVSLDPVAAQ